MIKNRYIAAVALGGALVLGASSGCDVVAGDSIIVQSATGQTNPGLVGESTVNNVTEKGVSGTAPCDYIPTVASDVAKYHPAKESLAFSGNAWTVCMAHRSGQAIVNKYHDDLVTLTNFLLSKNVKVIYSAPICNTPGSGWFNGDPAFRQMEQALANFYRYYGNHVAYSEIAAQSVCPGWHYIRSYRGPDSFHLSATGISIYAPALRRESQQVNP